MRANSFHRVGLVLAAFAFMGWLGYSWQGDSDLARAVGSAADQPPTISAVGTGSVPAPGNASTNTVNIIVEAQSSGDDVQAVLKTVQDKAAAIKAALENAGIASSRIMPVIFDVAAVPGVAKLPGVPAPAPAVPGGSLQPGGVNITQGFQVDTTGPEEMVVATRAAIQGGATSVNSFARSTGDMVQPEATALRPAIKQATEQAEALVQEAARARGVSLGQLRSVSVESPVFVGISPNSGFWRIQVTIMYDMAG